MHVECMRVAFVCRALYWQRMLMEGNTFILKKNAWKLSALFVKARDRFEIDHYVIYSLSKVSSNFINWETRRLRLLSRFVTRSIKLINYSIFRSSSVVECNPRRLFWCAEVSTTKHATTTDINKRIEFQSGVEGSYWNEMLTSFFSFLQKRQIKFALTMTHKKRFFMFWHLLSQQIFSVLDALWIVFISFCCFIFSTEIHEEIDNTGNDDLSSLSDKRLFSTELSLSIQMIVELIAFERICCL